MVVAAVAAEAAAGGKSVLAFPLAPMSDKGGRMEALAPPYPPPGEREGISKGEGCVCAKQARRVCEPWEAYACVPTSTFCDICSLQLR